MKSSWTRAFALLAACVGIAFQPACLADSSDVGSTSEALGAMDSGAGAGIAKFDEDPCDNPAAFAKKHGYNLIVAKPGEHKINGTPQKDLIVGTEGDDVIHAGGGDDVVCARGGEDIVYGEEGDDYLDGGSDNDTLYGGAGNDILHGRGGGDYLWGGAGDDMLFGDILDDHLYGEEGDDLLIGGHGTDYMHGGPGNDYLRGDTGTDEFVGGEGRDVASFATAMPPGQPDVVGKANPIDGVRVDFTDDCQKPGDPTKHDGCANGDGGNEPLDGIEIVIGSPYDDKFVSGGKNVTFVGGFGRDSCDGKDCGTALPDGAAGKVFVSLDEAKARDVGVVILGTPGADSIDIVRTADADVRVRPNAGTSLFAGPGCKPDGAAVVCNSKHAVRYVAAYMDDGNDEVKLAEAAGSSKGFPVDFTAHVAGGDGSDTLRGGDEQDVLFSGPTGSDKLYGGAGDDALLSESRKWPKKACAANDPDPHCDEDKPNAANYTDGPDELFGGPGDDQLVADYPCGGHHYSGGGGKDVAGFARSGRFAIHAQLAGKASKVTEFHGKSFNPELCDKSHGTTMEDDLEILEASDGNDELWGNDESNIIWGREGDDVIHGLGGDDFLYGDLGDDKLFGGGGNDKLVPGKGNDQVFPNAQ